MAEESTDAATTAAKVPEKIVFKLSKPIVGYGKEVLALEMRRPTGKDLLQVGNPVIFYPNTDPIRIEHDMFRVVAMVARLANVPTPALETLEPNELTSLAWAISPFFVPLV